MIKNKDRSKWWGASETSAVMGNWETKTFMELFLKKVGVNKSSFSNQYLLAGNIYERRIAQSLGIPLKFDRCIKIRKYRLRVNLDSESKDCIYEIKTHKKTDKEWKLPKAYIQQCQVQMWATKKYKCKIVAYAMEEENYNNFFLDIDNDKVEIYDIPYDKEWVEQEYLPRLKYLAMCLRKKKTPNKLDFEKEINKWL